MNKKYLLILGLGLFFVTAGLIFQNEVQAQKLLEGTRPLISNHQKERIKKPLGKSLFQEKKPQKTRQGAMVARNRTWHILEGALVVGAFLALTQQLFKTEWSLWGTLSLFLFFLHLLASYLVGKSSLVSLGLFILGLGLLILEMSLPGFSLPGISGIIAIYGSLMISMESTRLASITLGLSLGLSGLVLAYFWKSGKRPIYLNKFTLKETFSKDWGYSTSPPLDLEPGALGKTLTPLRPSGYVVINEKKYDAISDQGYLEKSSWVEVVAIESGKILVRRK